MTQMRGRGREANKVSPTSFADMQHFIRVIRVPGGREPFEY